jgi:hypothetical protein
MITKKQFLALNPCQKSLNFIDSCDSLSDAWNKCARSDWMLWLLPRGNLATKEQTANLAKQFVEHVKHLDSSWGGLVTDCADCAAGCADCAAGCADCAAGCAAVYAAGYAADCAADCAAAAKECAWQCDIIRATIPNPFI